jgi:hypothetical protein
MDSTAAAMTRPIGEFPLYHASLKDKVVLSNGAAPASDARLGMAATGR